MYDKEQVRQLYDKMSSISVNLQSLDNNLNNLEEELTDSFTIDENVVESHNIQNQSNSVSEIKNSIDNVVLNCLRSNF